MSETDNTHNPNAQPLLQHLIELRSRLLKSILVIFIVFIALVSFANPIFDFVAQPLLTFLPEKSQMIATDPASPFLTPFKLTIYVAFVLSVPFLLWQIWLFIAPGLYENEKRVALPLFISSVILFYAGMAFAYYVVFPLVFSFFTTVGPENVTVMTDIERYQSFVLKLFFAFGLAFEIPVATMICVAAGLVQPKKLARKRPYVIVCCFVVGMLLTPPDVISQVLLAVPMWLLFEMGLIFSKLLLKKHPEETCNPN